jgi:hypothetical protein
MGWVVNVTPQLRFTPGERTCGTRWKEWWVNLRVDLDTQARGKVPVLGIDGRKMTSSQNGGKLTLQKDKLLAAWKLLEKGKTQVKVAW